MIYLNQKDQKTIKTVADYIGSNGICKSGESLRITGTPGGDAIKEVKCV